MAAVPTVVRVRPPVGVVRAVGVNVSVELDRVALVVLVVRVDVRVAVHGKSTTAAVRVAQRLALAVAPLVVHTTVRPARVRVAVPVRVPGVRLHGGGGRALVDGRVIVLRVRARQAPGVRVRIIRAAEVFVVTAEPAVDTEGEGRFVRVEPTLVTRGGVDEPVAVGVSVAVGLARVEVGERARVEVAGADAAGVAVVVDVLHVRCRRRGRGRRGRRRRRRRRGGRRVGLARGLVLGDDRGGFGEDGGREDADPAARGLASVVQVGHLGRVQPDVPEVEVAHLAGEVAAVPRRRLPSDPKIGPGNVVRVVEVGNAARVPLGVGRHNGSVHVDAEAPGRVVSVSIVPGAGRSSHRDGDVPLDGDAVLEPSGRRVPEKFSRCPLVVLDG